MTHVLQCALRVYKVPVYDKLPCLASQKNKMTCTHVWCHSLVADYPALSVDRAGGGNPLYAEDTPNQEFLIWCAPIQEFLIRCTPIQEFEFTDSVLVFVRGVIWHQEGYYCYIISQMNTFIINKILPRKCLPLLTACRHL